MDAKLLRDLRNMAERTTPNVPTSAQYVWVSSRNLLELLDYVKQQSEEIRLLKEVIDDN